MNRIGLSIALVLLGGPLHAQWLNQPTAGMPRTADGVPNLDGAAAEVS